jgi:predicted ArsR family transcriptional regulator
MAWWQRQFGGSTRGRIVAMLRREEHSVEELAAALALTDNAVRAQLATLERDGVVHSAGVRREGMVGKPATLYRVGSETTTLFSSAYAPLLSALLAELSDRLPARQLTAVVRAAGRRLAPAASANATLDERARAGAGLLADLGADAELVRTKEGYEIRGHSCVLSAAVTTCPATCGAVEALLSEVTGTRVQERCDRTREPRCHFFIPAPSQTATR